MAEKNNQSPADSDYGARPRVAITLGDPAGIGPEVIVGAWREAAVHERARPLVVGHPEIVRRAVRLLGNPIEVVEIAGPEEAVPSPALLPVIACGDDAVLELPSGEHDARGGQAAYESLVKAAELALAGRVDAITTAPLSKAALWKAGHRYPGHTELLGELCGARDVAMMLYLPPGEAVRGPAGLGVVHVTLHTALRDVFAMLTPDAILKTCRLAHAAARCFKKVAGDCPNFAESSEQNRTVPFLSAGEPRIGVCALNPHAGEDGLFGDEEQRLIRPAVEQGIVEGLPLVGPLPADTLMVRARDGEFDAVVAMYHDQGHIALKLLGMHRAVNVTLGLPIIRTSVAHGTAFDRAWRGEADSGGMVAAITVAAELARQSFNDQFPMTK